MKRISLFSAICLFWWVEVCAQSYTLSGFVRERESGEALGYVSIMDSSGKQGVLTNLKGYYTYKADSGHQVLKVALSGYSTLSIPIEVRSDSSLDIEMSRSNYAIDTIEISSQKSWVYGAKVGVVGLSLEQVRHVPTLGGESDILKAIQLTPGVQFGQEGTAGLFVRGGSPDQNLILLDDMPVYNVNHLFGFVSIFPTEALKTANVIKAGFPAKYGGRLSSVLELQTREGNLKEWKKSISISPLTLHLLTEGPIVKDKISSLVVFRRSLLDLLIRPFTTTTFSNQGVKGGIIYSFYDVAGKLNILLSPKDRLGISIYNGRDKGGINLEYINPDNDSLSNRRRSGVSWGNTTISLRHQRVVNRNIFLQNVIGYTRYGNETELWTISDDKRIDSPSFQETTFRFSSHISDVILQSQVETRFLTNLAINAGLQTSFRSFRPYIIELSEQKGATRSDTTYNDEFSVINAVYSAFGEIEWQPVPPLTIHSGIRFEGFWNGEKIKPTWQPRISVGYLVSEKISFRAAYSLIYQQLHMLANSGLGLPADIWVPATDRFPQSRSHLVSAGIYTVARSLKFSIEGYYKTLENLLEYKDGTSFYKDFGNWESKVTQGQGVAYGAEVFVQKQQGKLNGWLSYTLSWNYRTFAEINQGQRFPFRYDRRHNLALFLSRQLGTPRRNISATWTYTTGAWATVPTEVYITPTDIREDLIGNAENYFSTQSFYKIGYHAVYSSGRNNIKMRPFHKLDIAYQSGKTDEKGRERVLGLGIYNAYGRRNPYFLFYSRERYKDPISNQWYTYAGIREFSVLMFIPYVSFSYHF